MCRSALGSVGHIEAPKITHERGNPACALVWQAAGQGRKNIVAC